MTELQKRSAKLLTFFGAENGARTRDLNLGKVALYQLSYFRMSQMRLQRYEEILKVQNFLKILHFFSYCL